MPEIRFDDNGEVYFDDAGDPFVVDGCCCDDPCTTASEEADLDINVTGTILFDSPAYYIDATLSITVPTGYKVCAVDWGGAYLNKSDCSAGLGMAAPDVTSLFPESTIDPPCESSPDGPAETVRWTEFITAAQLHYITVTYTLVNTATEEVCGNRMIAKRLALTCSHDGITWEVFDSEEALCAAKFVEGDYPPFVTISFEGNFNDITLAQMGGPGACVSPPSCYGGSLNLTGLNGAQMVALPITSFSDDTFDYSATWGISGYVVLNAPMMSGIMDCFGITAWTCGGESVETIPIVAIGDVYTGGCAMTASFRLEADWEGEGCEGLAISDDVDTAPSIDVSLEFGVSTYQLDAASDSFSKQLQLMSACTDPYIASGAGNGYFENITVTL